MADWNTSYNWMMDNEDPQRACAQAPEACPGGVAVPCDAICGINSGAWPEEFAAIAAVDQPRRAPLVQQFYENHFWTDWYAQLESIEVCKRVFDFAVNGGSGIAVRCLQQALNSLTGPYGAQLVDDGDWAPVTLGAANAADPVALVAAFQAERIAFYQAIVAADPSKAVYLPAWTARAQK
jgi:hypothetical protein